MSHATTQNAASRAASNQSASSHVSTIHGGWYLLATARELEADLTPLEFAGRAVLAVRTDDGYAVADSTCPHRGANLGVGGTLSGNRITCPFHGRTVTIGATSGPGMCVRTYPSVYTGGLLFARFGDADPEGRLEAELTALIGDVDPVVAVDRVLACPPELVIENAFDPEHFNVVHHVPATEDMRAEPDQGVLVIGGGFRTFTTPFGDTRIRDHARRVLGDAPRVTSAMRSAFRATAYSPTFVATTFGNDAQAPVIMTGTVPVAGTGPRPSCRIRVVISARTPAEVTRRLAQGSERAIGEDAPIWENLDLAHAPQLSERDETMREFHRFCDEFPVANP